MGLLNLILEGHPEAAYALLERNPELSDEKNDAGDSVALVALNCGYRRLAEQIFRSQSQPTVFEYAAFGDIYGLERLVNPESVSQFSSAGYQCLHYAAQFGQFECVKFLISKKAPINEVSKNDLSCTPLHLALKNHEESVVRELVHEGADLSIRNGDGHSALDLLHLLSNEPLKKFLLDFAGH